MIEADYSQNDRWFILKYTVTSLTHPQITSKTYEAFSFGVAPDCGPIIVVDTLSPAYATIS